MQPALAALPELDRVGLEQVAAPVLRARHTGPAEAPLGVGDAPLEGGAIGQHRALRRRPGRDLAAARARGEVLVALVGVKAADPARGADLAVELQPAPRQGGDARGVEVAALGALVAREEPEAALVDSAQQHVAAAGPALRVDGRERHRVGLVDALGGGVLEPARELRERVGVERADVEAVGVVLVAEGGQVRGARRRLLRHAGSTSTVVALTTAVALSPGLRPSWSTASRDITDTIR